MSLLSWSDHYLIGNDIIDIEHKELFRLINDFHTHWLEAHDRRDIARVLNQLIAYAQMHFQHEENIMGAAGYPILVQHQKIHEALIDSIFQLHQSYSEGNLNLEINTMKFVRNWLIEHILKNDYLFRDFLKRQKGSGEAAA